jgi:hypothetical protein
MKYTMFISDKKKMPTAIDALSFSTDENRYWNDEELANDRGSPTLSSSSTSSAMPPSPSSTSSPPPESARDSHESSPPPQVDPSASKGRARSRAPKPYRMASSFELGD